MRFALIAALGIALAGSTTLAQGQMKMPAKSMVADALMAKEHTMLDAVRTKNVKVFSDLVVAGSWSVDDNGYMMVDEFIKMLGNPTNDMKIDVLKAQDMKVIDVDATTAIVTYKAEQKGTYMGQPLPALTYATTIWTNHGGSWRAVFHQESPAAKH